MDIEFEKDGVVKTTHVKCTDDLIAAGWKVVKKPESAPKSVKKPSTKKAK